jgi:mannan polymerase II complex MNN11 subunit
MRHALTLWPFSTYFWHLDQNALIMNPDLTIDSIMTPRRMEKLMIKDQPIVPPDSVIKTFTHLKGDQIDFALTQDGDGLAPGSFILRQGDWARFFLDTWFDPLYRSYNFQKADTHALVRTSLRPQKNSANICQEHIVQWHPTILSKLALVPQQVMNSYNQAENSTSKYSKGDFVIRFNGCEQKIDRSCETEAQSYLKEWRTNFNPA